MSLPVSSSSRPVAPSLSLALLGALALAGCPAEAGPLPIDASGGADAGARTDAGATERDAGGLGADAPATGEDGGGVGADAGAPDLDAGAAEADAGGEVDACVPPPCAPPPPGCDYVGATECTCGTLVCAPPPDCGTASCGRQQYCDFDADCGGDGRCVDFDPSALCPDVFSPVCGCDGVTYGNSCEAHRAGVDVAADGECAPPAGACTVDRDCAGGEYCAECRGIGGPIRVCLRRGTAC